MRHTAPLALITFSAIACAGTSAPSPPPEPPAAPTPAAQGGIEPAEVCARVIETLRPEVEAKRGKPVAAEEIRALAAHCEEEERGERAEGEERWRCRAACLLGARTGADAEQCHVRCPLPPVRLDCDTALPIADLQADLGAQVKPIAEGRDDGEGSSCARSFAVDGKAAVLSLELHGTSARAREAVEEAGHGAEAAARVPALDAAKRWSTPFEGVRLCHVELAKHRVSMHFSVAQAECAFDRIERLAVRAAARLP